MNLSSVSLKCFLMVLNSPSPGLPHGRLSSDAGRGFVSCAARHVPVHILHQQPAALACRNDTRRRHAAEAAAAAGETKPTQIHFIFSFRVEKKGSFQTDFINPPKPSP